MNLLVNIDVDDLEKATVFYTAAFGLRLGRRFESSGVELLGSSARIYLLLKSPGSPASPATTQVRNYDRHWTPVHLDFVVEQIEPAVAKAVAAGARIEKPVATHKGESSHCLLTRSATDSVWCSFLAAAMTKSRCNRQASFHHFQHGVVA